MKIITQKPFRLLADCEKIYQFLLEIYERDWRNGVLAPFLNTHTHHFLTGWISPILTKTASGNAMEKSWRSAFMKIRWQTFISAWNPDMKSWHPKWCNTLMKICLQTKKAFNLFSSADRMHWCVMHNRWDTIRSTSVGICSMIIQMNWIFRCRKVFTL